MSKTSKAAISSNFPEAYARFARVSLGIYLCATSIALAVLVAFLLTDGTHEQEEIKEQLRGEVAERASYLQQHLTLLIRELRRLGLRSEVNLVDQNLTPEKSLLELSHQGSSFFNLGVAIVDDAGTVMWTEPRGFLKQGLSFAAEPWFRAVQRNLDLRIVPVAPERDDAVLYVVSPVIRNQRFAGALVGGIDLAHGDDFITDQKSNIPLQTILATKKGEIVYPPKPPEHASQPEWLRSIAEQVDVATLSTIPLEGRDTVVGAANVSGMDLVLLLMADEKVLLGASRERTELRLGLAFVLALLPLVPLVLLLRHSLKILRATNERAMREERLSRVGEAANLIAHEVKNALNSIRMAAEMAQNSAPEQVALRERAREELRGEINRLTTFTGELMLFSKGITPRRAQVNLNDLTEKVCGLGQAAAAEIGASLKVAVPEESVTVSADPQLLHVVLSNLLSNSVDAVASNPDGGKSIEVELAAADPVRLRVSDNGAGLSEEMEPRLFEPFQSGKANGVGIGLALSKRIALAHGGDLEFLRGNVGATFVLTLPRLS